MAEKEAHRVGKTGLDGLLKHYPDLEWKASADGNVFVWDKKVDDFVHAPEGSYVVNEGDRYYVTDTKPEGATATPAKAAKAE